MRGPLGRTPHVRNAAAIMASRIYMQVRSEKRPLTNNVQNLRFFRSIQSRKVDPIFVDTVVEVGACVNVISFWEFCSEDGSR